MSVLVAAPCCTMVTSSSVYTYVIKDCEPNLRSCIGNKKNVVVQLAMFHVCCVLLILVEFKDCCLVLIVVLDSCDCTH